MRRYKRVDQVEKTNQRFGGSKDARIPVISIILMVAFVGIFVAMVATYVLVPEPTPVVAPRPTPKPTPIPETTGIENLRLEDVVVYASERSDDEISYDTALMQVTGDGATSEFDVVATVAGVSTYLRSTGGTPIQPGDQVLLISVPKRMGCGCPQPIIEIEPGDQVRVVVRHVPTRHVLMDTTVTAVAGDKYTIL
ncbi:MAG: hypothetical protein PHS47_03495 [Methanocellales archaeon]|nr:hypothetical protein [Methanocellales archaeon]MDD3421347.1 hypothetical protein [Methanocellales archaeon]MDD4898904.1 hypothetical protein [Methanocellales archaeon]MDD5446911.1 hypothetical protein [Methanocellales archaeon]